MESWKEAGRNSDGKADTGKIRMGLLFTQFSEFLEGTADVLTFGAEKYPKPPLDDSWRDVPNAIARYTDAFYRHIQAYFGKGEEFDPESGRHHLFHAICNLLFIYELSKKEAECETVP